MGQTMYVMAMKGKSKNIQFSIKKQVVLYAQKHGIKPTVAYYKMSRNTVRKLLRSFEQYGNKGLQDKRKGPNNIPHKTHVDVEEHVIACRQRSPFFGPLRLKDNYDLNISTNTIYRILKQKNLIKKKKKKHHKKNDLRETKLKYKALTYLQYDIKHLYDIPNYWVHLQLIPDLPKYQYTIRDVKSGWVFLGYSIELSELNARVLMDLILSQIKNIARIPGKEITIQTDNGSEFSGQARFYENSNFTKNLVLDHEIQHKYIPPGCCNANADVESFHNTVEVEFFDYEIFNSKEMFFKKINTYQLWYNIERKNYSKKRRSPLEITKEEISNSKDISLITVVDLDKISIVTPEIRNSGGQTLPDFAVSIKIVKM